MSGFASCSSSTVFTFLCRRGTQINNTFHAFWCQWHAALLTIWLKKKYSAFWNFHVSCLWSSCREIKDFQKLIKLIFFLFSSPHEPWKHPVLFLSLFSVTLMTPGRSFERQSYVIVSYCQSQPIRCGYWSYSASLKASWSGGSMGGDTSIWKAAHLLIKPWPRVLITQHYWIHLESATGTGQ